MTVYQLQQLFTQYGIYVLAALVLWDYLSLPGLPGSIGPVLMGVMAGLGIFPLRDGILAAFLAAMLGSMVIYLIGWVIPKPLMKFYSRRKKMTDRFRGVDQYMKRHGSLALLRCRFHPTFRTFISIPAGILRMNFVGYFISSLLGNGLFMAAVVGAVGFITSVIV